MTASKKTSTKKAAETGTTEPQSALEHECNVDGCLRMSTMRGLCTAHWATHRGLAGPR